jgi:PKD repeat protein
MDGSTFACSDNGYVLTKVNVTPQPGKLINDVLGYTDAYRTYLMSLVLDPEPCNDPVAKIAMSIDPANPLKVNFDGAASLNADSYTWNFGGAGTADYTNGPAKPSFTYSAAGDYTVTLKVTGPCGPAHTTTSLVTLSQNPVARMAYQLDPLVDRKVCFDGTQSLNETDYTWNFGDGATSTLAKPCYTYPASGTYVVALTVSDGSGKSNSTTGQVTVDKLKPVAKIMMQLAPTDPRTVNFDGTASLYEFGYSWDFGDGSPANTNGTISHTYAPGTFYPKLTVTGITGLTNTTTTRVIIK